MTMRFIITLAREAGDGSAAIARSLVVAIERDTLAPETLGLTLAEAKAVLAELQAATWQTRLPPTRRRSAVAPVVGWLGA
jgi:hypothetical protein